MPSSRMPDARSPERAVGHRPTVSVDERAWQEIRAVPRPCTDWRPSPARSRFRGRSWLCISRFDPEDEIMPKVKTREFTQLIRQYGAHLESRARALLPLLPAGWLALVHRMLDRVEQTLTKDERPDFRWTAIRAKDRKSGG